MIRNLHNNGYRTGNAVVPEEKKDTAHHPNGRSEDSDFDDPQANQAKGRRKYPAQPHHSAAPNGSQQSQPNPKQDNTVPGGNRPKISHPGTDHN